MDKLFENLIKIVKKGWTNPVLFFKKCDKIVEKGWTNPGKL